MRQASLCSVMLLVACGGDDGGGGMGIDPTQVMFGDTALVVVVNPVINEANKRTVAAPGTVKDKITLESDDGIIDVTGPDGIAVLAPLTAGTRTITVSGGGLTGSFVVTMADKELREVALSAASGVEIMVNLDYKTNAAFEVSPTMTASEVNTALQVSDRVVFFKGGTYTGDLDFSGSRVTLFGEGVLGGAVNIAGNVTISGSDSRIRGTHITGNLTIPASGTGLSFSRVDGAVSAQGSDTILLANALCGAETITGSGTLVVGNAGTAPTATCP